MGYDDIFYNQDDSDVNVDNKCIEINDYKYNKKALYVDYLLFQATNDGRIICREYFKKRHELEYKKLIKKLGKTYSHLDKHLNIQTVKDLPIIPQLDFYFEKLSAGKSILDLGTYEHYYNFNRYNKGTPQYENKRNRRCIVLQDAAYMTYAPELLYQTVSITKLHIMERGIGFYESVGYLNEIYSDVNMDNVHRLTSLYTDVFINSRRELNEIDFKYLKEEFNIEDFIGYHMVFLNVYDVDLNINEFKNELLSNANIIDTINHNAFEMANYIDMLSHNEYNTIYDNIYYKYDTYKILYNDPKSPVLTKIKDIRTICAIIEDKIRKLYNADKVTPQEKRQIALDGEKIMDCINNISDRYCAIIKIIENYIMAYYNLHKKEVYKKSLKQSERCNGGLLTTYIYKDHYGNYYYYLIFNYLNELTTNIKSIVMNKEDISHINTKVNLFINKLEDIIKKSKECGIYFINLLCIKLITNYIIRILKLVRSDKTKLITNTKSTRHNKKETEKESEISPYVPNNSMWYPPINNSGKGKYANKTHKQFKNSNIKHYVPDNSMWYSPSDKGKYKGKKDKKFKKTQISTYVPDSSMWDEKKNKYYSKYPNEKKLNGTLMGGLYSNNNDNDKDDDDGLDEMFEGLDSLSGLILDSKTVNNLSRFVKLVVNYYIEGVKHNANIDKEYKESQITYYNINNKKNKQHTHKKHSVKLNKKNNPMTTKKHNLSLNKSKQNGTHTKKVNQMNNIYNMLKHTQTNRERLIV
jgi:hypothetical protein